MNNKMKSVLKRGVAFLLAAVCALPFGMSAGAEGEPDGKESLYGDKFIMVSLGDSYSSGEGNEKFYGQDKSDAEKVKDQDWLAHRSEEAWSGKLTSKYVEGTMSQYRSDKNKKSDEDVQWYFYAASGAVTQDFDGQQVKNYNYGDEKGSQKLDRQLSAFDNIEKGEVDYVTLSVGGNDLGFADIVKHTTLSSDFLGVTALTCILDIKIKKLEGETKDNIKNVYRDIQNEAGSQARIIVAGYPELYGNFSGDTSIFLGQALIQYKEAAFINSACDYFDSFLKKIVQECRDEEGLDIYYASVLDGFKGHGMYSEDPYLTEIGFEPREQDINQKTIGSSYSAHPNDKGIQVYANAVQSVINQIEATEIEAVLVLDTSGSMEGTPIEETRKAATGFCETLFENSTSSAVGVVTYDYSAQVQSGFSLNADALKNRIGEIESGGNTNIEDGLLKAYEMLQNGSAKKKIILLMSDGKPNEGLTGDDLIAYADEIKEAGITIFTLGFFQSLGYEASGAQDLMKAIAGAPENYFDVDSADKLLYYFGDISEQINGQRYIYIRIACPVEVRVSFDGEVLSSEEDELNTRTSFGTLSFENNNEEDSTDTTKILRLKEDYKYNISIEGTGRGKMDYTISFMDGNGEYTDVRTFKNIKINRKTSVKTVASHTEETVLKVDSDGDGVTDIAYAAGVNSRGKEIESYILHYIAAGVGLLILVMIWIKIASVKKKRKKI